MSNQSDNKKRADLVRAHLAPYRSALDEIGVGPRTVAKKRKQQLNARLKTPIKLRGEAPVGTILVPGYRVIVGGGVTETEDGRMIFNDMLIEHSTPNWQIQEKATSALEKIFDVPQKQIIEHTGEISMANFPPEPQSMAEWESMYEKMKAGKHDPNDPNSTPGA